MIHGDFEVGIDLAAPLGRVWSAYRDPAVRARWARLPGPDSRFELDFRPGGVELVAGTFAPSGTPEVIESTRCFVEIVEPRRIVSTHTLVLDVVLRWASLVAVSFAPMGDGTRVTHHEQYTLLAWTGDGANDAAHLAGATRLSLNRLASVVEEARHRALVS